MNALAHRRRKLVALFQMMVAMGKIQAASEFDTLDRDDAFDTFYRIHAFDTFGKPATTAAGTILAGGPFAVPSFAYSYITSWASSQWNAAGTFNAKVNSILYHSGFGKIFVTGNFTTINGATIYYVASTTDGLIYASVGYPSANSYGLFLLKEDAGHLLVFRSSILGNRALARYDGSTWTSVYPYHKCTTSFNGMCMHGGQVFAAGYNGAVGISYWDGSTWMDIGAWRETYWHCTALISFNGVLYVCKDISAPKETMAWSGENNGERTDWGVSLGTQPITKMLEFGGKIIGISKNAALGSPFLFYTYGSSPWATYAGGVNGIIADAAVIGGKLYIVGQFTTVGAGALSSVHAAMYDGASWHSMSTGPLGALTIGGV